MVEKNIIAENMQTRKEQIKDIETFCKECGIEVDELLDSGELYQKYLDWIDQNK